MIEYDVCIIGGGPAGLAAALEIASDKVCLIEREKQIGGILKQCIHDGFGLHKFSEQLTGPEYIKRYIDQVEKSAVKIYKKTFVSNISYIGEKKILIDLINPEYGLFTIKTKTVLFASGCRERTAKQVFIHGERPAGVLTAGTAQYFVNVLGYLPCKECVVLGSGDIGLIMARRLTLEGAKVKGVYEIKNSPSGLKRNIAQCLHDFDIPLHLSETVIKTHGDDRLIGVTTAKVDSKFNVINGSEKYIKCDGLILSVGLIPENEVAKELEIPLDSHTKGPIVDQNMMTAKRGIFACGNQVHVNDLVDYVSESGEIAAKACERYIKLAALDTKHINVSFNENDLLYVVPQMIDIMSEHKKVTFYIRSKKVLKDCYIKIMINEKELFSKKYIALNPPELQVIKIDVGNIQKSDQLKIVVVKDKEK